MSHNQARIDGGSAPMIVPVILSGGAGQRLWPLSRELYPKQLMALTSTRSMLQETVLRVGDGARYARPLVICNHEHRFVIAEQLRVLGVEPEAILLEPLARNTAPAVAVSALYVQKSNPEAMLLVLPADHLVQDVEAFAGAVEIAVKAAALGRLVTFAIPPTRPETGYGYIQGGAALPGAPGALELAAFVEKPDRDHAERLLARGDHFWNSGMFLFPVALLLGEFKQHAPDLLAAARGAIDNATRDLEFTRLAADEFARAPSISIDHAVMERTRRAATVPVDMGWTDVGAWSALWEVGVKDASGNVVVGDAVIEDTRDSYIRADRGLTAVLGLRDVVVVASDDAVLVADRARVQDVRKIVDRLKAAGRTEASTHRTGYRPWGHFTSIHAGDRFQVKEIVVKPGGRLSLQKHMHRAEHWVVVRGTALVTRDGESFLLSENESLYIAIGCVHRLENPGKIPLNLIEIQTGAYLGEDDIVRLEDGYGRT